MITYSISNDGSLGLDNHQQMVARIKYPDHEECYIVPDLRHANCVLCNAGWQLTGASFKEHVKVPDMGYAHSACWGRHLTVSELAHWKELLAQTDFVVEQTKVVANEYSPTPSAAMWFEFETAPPDKGWSRISAGTNPKLRIGARKRVHQIIMTDGRVSKKAFDNSTIKQAMVTSDWVNPNFVLVHSYNPEQSLMFLRALAYMRGSHDG